MSEQNVSGDIYAIADRFSKWGEWYVVRYPTGHDLQLHTDRLAPSDLRNLADWIEARRAEHDQ
jgi:hypothetical protein